MSSILANEYRNATTMKVYYERDKINLEPDYQRLGNIWSQSKKQLLIDSILNEYDIPKIYFHEIYPTMDNKKFAVIDGRQRLEAIFDFIDGKFPLSGEIVYNKDEGIDLKNLYYKDLSTKYPYIKINFDSFVLPIIIIQTSDLDLIEDMFSRLNDGVLLNAAEKRNAYGGEAVAKIKLLSEDTFFQNKIRITNKRFQHYEIATRFLMIEEKLSQNTTIDTSKGFLDAFVKNNKSNNKINEYYNLTLDNLIKMNKVFEDKDPLLKRQGDMVIYYLLFKIADNNQQLGLISRNKIVTFQDQVYKYSGDDANENYQDFVTYFYYSQQGTNGFSNIKTRLKILTFHLGITNSCPAYEYLFKV